MYDLNLMFKELSLTREKVIKYDLLCVKYAEMEARLIVLEEKHCGKTSGRPTVHNRPKVLSDVVLRTNEHNVDYQPECERPLCVLLTMARIRGLLMKVYKGLPHL